MTPRELLEQVTTAHRERDLDGRIKSHPAWHDLNATERLEAFEATLTLRKLESAFDAQGQSTTVKALLARLRPKR